MPDTRAGSYGHGMTPTIHHRDGHHGWNRDLEPVLEVSSGDVIEVHTIDAAGGQLDETSTVQDVVDLDQERANPLTGPVRVVGAQPGDVLAVHILELHTSGWGWTANIPGFGLLADEFPDPHLIHTSYDAGRLEFGDLATWRPAPFIGTIGVAPSEPGTHPVIPPRTVGGNLDLKDVGIDTTLLLPVAVDGAMLSLGDTHALQGDGEVCGTAVETPLEVVLRVDVLDDRSIDAPHVVVPEPLAIPHGPYHVTTGVGPDLMSGARDATRAMVAELDRRGVDPRDGYLLCSVFGNLRIGEVVDAPNWVVAMEFPLSVLS